MNLGQWVNENGGWNGILSIIISCISLCIANLSYRNAKALKDMQKDRLCFDLMQQRMAIYESFKRTIAQALSVGDAPDGLAHTFLKETRDICWLFGDEVEELRKKVSSLLGTLHAAEAVLRKSAEKGCVTGDHDFRCKKSEESIEKLAEMSSCLSDTFKKYIDFSKYTISNR